MDTNLTSTPSPNLDNVNVHSDYNINYTKFLLAIILISLLGYNLYTYLYYGVDMFGNELTKISKGLANNVEKNASLSKKMLNDSLEKTNDVVKDTTGVTVNNKLDETLKHRKKHRENNKADTSNSSIQKGKQKKACFVGIDNGVRSCVRMDQFDKCLSEKIYPTMDVCINPKLRV